MQIYIILFSFSIIIPKCGSFRINKVSFSSYRCSIAATEDDERLPMTDMIDDDINGPKRFKVRVEKDSTTTPSLPSKQPNELSGRKATFGSMSVDDLKSRIQPVARDSIKKLVRKEEDLNGNHLISLSIEKNFHFRFCISPYACRDRAPDSTKI